MFKLGIAVAVVSALVLTVLAVGACLGSFVPSWTGLAWNSGQHHVTLGREGLVHLRIIPDMCGPEFETYFEYSLAWVSTVATALVGGVYLLLIVCGGESTTTSSP